eukprot:CAMPEP_0181330328 /NCGR_PEP_ID=MMETSP1101-20121128/23837_1 /TAXON_ID=46948 /ORGANISM="Rhodomonas abbreviata, Strain Caron Lab Isolate" /LENGTH=243 /DNA_ID=CAMNT_0023439569 /DNA_START=53 /DNA_END=780 /DNA_ORIENTATION=+
MSTSFSSSLSSVIALFLFFQCTAYAWTPSLLPSLQTSQTSTAFSLFPSSSSTASSFSASSSARASIRGYSQLRMVSVAEKDDNEREKAMASEEVEAREWVPREQRLIDYELMPGEVAVRFVNAPGRFPSDGSNDIVAAAKPGDVLIAVGDSVGVVLPRGCMTGLCGACTCDLEDPAFENSRSMLRACSTKVMVPEDCDEMVVDVYRMLNKKGGSKKDPMARFSNLDDPNDGFKARWNMPEEGG